MTASYGGAHYEILSSSHDSGIGDCTFEIMRSFENEYGTRLHWHHGLEINLMLEGHVRYFVDGVRHDAYEDELVFVDSGDVHLIENPDPGTYATALIMIIPDGFLSRCVPGIKKPRFHLKKRTAEYAAVVEGMHRIADLIASGVQEDPLGNLLVQKELLGVLYPLYQVAYSAEGTSAHRHDLIQDVLDYAGTHYMEPLAVADAAKHAGLQENYFCRWFLKQTGMSFHQYLCRIRLANALSLLLTTEETVLSCALSAGFSSDKPFAMWCRRIHGCTPLEYRNRHLVSTRG